MSTVADLSDVAAALVGVIAGVVYPSGTGQSPIASVGVKVYHGWPDRNTLNADIAAGRAHVSVWPTPTVRPTTGLSSDWYELSRTAATLTATVAGQTITIAGAVSVPQAVALLIDQRPYVYALQAGDTLATIAAALRNLIVADQPASVAGAVITVPGAHALSARLVTQGVAGRIVRREERVFQVSVWAQTFGARDALAGAIDAALADMRRIVIAYPVRARIAFASSRQDDDLQLQGIYRRDLLYRLEYPVTLTEVQTAVGIVQLNQSGGPSVDAQGPVRTSYH